jgi:hypothetical protein
MISGESLARIEDFESSGPALTTSSSKLDCSRCLKAFNSLIHVLTRELGVNWALSNRGFVTKKGYWW